MNEFRPLIEAEATQRHHDRTHAAPGTVWAPRGTRRRRLARQLRDGAERLGD